MRLFPDRFQVRSVLSLSLTLHSLENLVIARCFSNFSAHLAKFSQLKFRESVQFANIAKILPREIFRSTVLSQRMGVYVYYIRCELGTYIKKYMPGWKLAA